ncbi:MAG: hypothetical protein RLY31_2109 [Bacteroidota bacterium]
MKRESTITYLPGFGRSLPTTLLACLFFFSLPACQKEKAKGGAAPAATQQVDGHVAQARYIAETLEVPGTLLAFEETEIRPEISGRLVQLNLTEGSQVRKGDLLAKLFDADLQARLKKLEVQLGIAEKTLERQQELLKVQGISQQEVDLSELQVNNIKADMELVRVDISRTEIRAPYSGQLGLRNISTGAYVSPTTLITTLRQTTLLKLDFTVPEKYGVLFRKGSVVQFTVAGNSQPFNAVVMATEAAVDASTRTLKVRASVSGNHPALLPGTFANLQLTIGGGEDIAIPTRAVIPQARNKQVVVYRDGTPEYRVVETGIRDEQYVQILSGLEKGDTVLTTGLLAIRPGTRLTIGQLEP